MGSDIFLKFSFYVLEHLNHAAYRYTQFLVFQCSFSRFYSTVEKDKTHTIVLLLL